MGIVQIGKEEYEVRNVELRGGSISLDGRVIYLCNNLTPIQVKGEDCYISTVFASGDILVTGSIESALAQKNMIVWGRVFRPSAGGNRFYNYTASNVFKESKSRLSKKSELGRRLVIHLKGNFNSLKITSGNYSIEVYLDGQLGRVRSNKDIIVKGSIDGSRSEDCTYISRKV